MHIGVPAEIYPGEARVAATPETVKKLVAGGRHTVVIQAGAGERAAIRDSDFEAAGARIAATAAEAYQADVVLKVRKPDVHFADVASDGHEPGLHRIGNPKDAPGGAEL